MKSNAHVYIVLSVAFFIGLLGCGDTVDVQQDVLVPDVPPNEVAGYGQTLETLKSREVASREPMSRYLQLREKDPEAAIAIASIVPNIDATCSIQTSGVTIRSFS